MLSLACGVLTPGKLLSSPKEAVADPLPKCLLFGWWSSPVPIADPTWVQSTVSTRYGMPPHTQSKVGLRFFLVRIVQIQMTLH